MKKVWGYLGALSVLITIVSGIGMGDDIAAWIKLVGRWTSSFQQPLAEILLTLWSVVFVASLLITSYIVFRIVWQIAALGIAQVPIWLSWFKQRFLMAEMIDKKDALSIVQSSDFYRSKMPDATGRAHSHFNALAGISFTGPSERELMMQRQFLRQILGEFEVQRPNGVEGARYNRNELNIWLDSIFDKEVENKFGPIPKV
ncbi:hypothetical protein NAS141_19139 [Sulfitobacter sp. NAS-14.1]|nr:hypothetical protein NAS141_19139 [Sulfitobacter sp. NAS-14.1]